MLGIDIDIQDQVVRLAHVRRRGGNFVVTRTVSAALTGEAGQLGPALGARLGELIRDHGWSRQKAVMTLGRRSYFVKRFSGADLDLQGSGRGGLSRASIEALMEAAEGSVLAPKEELVFDFCFGTNGKAPSQHGVLLAGAEKSVVDAYGAAAARSGVKVVSLELRSLAAINGLMDHWAGAEGVVGVVYVEQQRGALAVLSGDELLSLQTFELTADQPEATAAETLAAELSRQFNMMRLSASPAAPQRLFVGAGQESLRKELEQRTELLSGKLDMDVTICGWPAGLNTVAESIAGGDPWQYLPAIGAALDGLRVSPTWFDFLHPRGRRMEHKRQVVWQPLVFMLVGVLALLGVFWLSLVQQRREELAALRRQLEQTLPERAEIDAAREKFESFRAFLPVRGEGNVLDGSRREYLRVLGEINALFPDPEVAYITNLTVADTTGASSGSAISIRGKVSQGEVLPSFIDRLNASRMFREVRQAGSLTRDDADTLYPHTFSVTGSFRRGGGSSTP